MDARKGNIFEILNGNKQFIIPVYQRYYSWGEEQCKRLWDDIVNMQKNGKPGHFVGSIVARYDDLAAVALSVARKMGRNVPKDLAVTGFDNDFISNYVSPALTTVEIRKEEVAKSAMEALLALIRNEKTDKNISITARLIIRDSTKQ